MRSAFSDSSFSTSGPRRRRRAARAATQVRLQEVLHDGGVERHPAVPVEPVVPGAEGERVAVGRELGQLPERHHVAHGVLEDALERRVGAEHELQLEEA